MQDILKMLAGAAVGAAVGFAISRAQTRRGRQCHVKANLIFSIIAGAVCGAAVVRYFISR